jgi:hypothetical protein
MLVDRISIKGLVRLRFSRRGELIWERWHENLVVTTGKNAFADIVAGGATSVASHMAIGDDNTISNIGMSSLQGTEHKRNTATVGSVLNTLQVDASFGAGLGGQVSVGEFGIFNNAVGGTMFARFTTNIFSLDPAENIDVDWSLTFGD